ncbi:MAG TPA: RNA methyltransferase, partial [Euzebya sp.]|nr:RNA methyltransferase [Euzebya sp.]
VGQVWLDRLDPLTASAQLHVEVAVTHRRHGFGADAVRVLLSTALRPTAHGGWGLNRIHMAAPGSDIAVRGLARRLALHREMRRRQDRWIEGIGVDDTYGWAVLADEWDGDAMQMRRAEPEPDVGMGPHPRPWPDAPHLDPLLLRDGDRRNVADRYRYWRHERIVADLAAHAHPFHVAIENWRHDSNIGTVVRNANAFGAAGVHVVGRRSWNRRGAMVTDRYLSVHHHDDVAGLAAWARDHDLALIGIDNLPGSVSLFKHPPPRRCVLLLGQEGPGLSDRAREVVQQILHIPQFGSTRSINAGVASGIAMAEWVRANGDPADG